MNIDSSFNNSFIYRKATKNDISSIASLVADLIGTCNLDNSKSILENNIYEITSTIDNYYVCEIENKVVGACGLSDIMKKDNYNLGFNNIREILYLAVSHEYQGNGIGTTLLNMCIKNINEMVVYEAWGDNGKYVNSKYVLERCGFKLIKDLGNDYYKKHNYCSFCVNKNKTCNSCLAQIWVKEK